MNGVRHHTWFSSALSSCYMVFARILELEWLLSNLEIEFLYTVQNFSERLSKGSYTFFFSDDLKSLHWWLDFIIKMKFGVFYAFYLPRDKPRILILFFQFIGQTFGELSKCGFVSGASSAWQFRRSLEISMFRHFSGLPICSFGRMWLSRTQENYGQTSNWM